MVELLVWKVKAVGKGAKDGGLPILVIITPNSTPDATAAVCVTYILLPLLVQVKGAAAKLVHPIVPDITNDDGNPIIILLDAGSAGVCFSLNVYVVPGSEFSYDDLSTAMDVMVEGVVICTDMPVVSCSIACWSLW